MFIETSWPRKKGDNAILYSNAYFAASKGARCFNFWYHMTGSGIGTLNIYQRSAKSTPIWTRSDDQGNKWKHGRVTIGKGQRSNYRVSVLFLIFDLVLNYKMSTSVMYRFVNQPTTYKSFTITNSCLTQIYMFSFSSFSSKVFAERISKETSLLMMFGLTNSLVQHQEHATLKINHSAHGHK